MTDRLSIDDAARVSALSNLILDHKGDRSFQALSEAGGGQVAPQRLYQMTVHPPVRRMHMEQMLALANTLSTPDRPVTPSDVEGAVEADLGSHWDEPAAAIRVLVAALAEACGCADPRAVAREWSKAHSSQKITEESVREAAVFFRQRAEADRG